MIVSKNPFHIMSKPAGPDCNLACKYCFYLEKEVLFKGGKVHRMSDEVLEALQCWFDRAIRAYRAAATSSGGAINPDEAHKNVAFREKCQIIFGLRCVLLCLPIDN